jgi:predicted ATPase
VLVGAAVVPVDELGPHRLKDFPAPVPLYCARIDGRGAEAFPPPKTLDARPTNLPATPPGMVGRDRELSEMADRLPRARILSITGRGGSGKTTLALVAANAALDDHPGGVWWIQLASKTDADAVLPAIASAIGVERTEDQQVADAIAARLGGVGASLLVLDNMEHLLDAAPRLAALLERVPAVRILVTTQAPLRLPEEEVLALGSLNDDAALELCQSAAVRAGRSRAFNAEERAELLAVCASLDWLPLAIELAAARLSLLTPAQLRARLERSLDVVKGDRRVAERHRSLSLTLDWSLGLLSEAARRLFTRMGVFADAVEFAEIEAVLGDEQSDVLDAVSELLEVGLLTRVETGDGRLRLGMPQALRRLARQRLDAGPDRADWQRAHAIRQLDRCRPGLYVHAESVEEAAGADEAEPEARFAIDRIGEVDPALAQALRIVTGIRHSHTGHIADAHSALDPVALDDVDDPVLRAGLLAARAQLAGHAGKTEAAVALVEQAIDALGDAEPRFRISLLTMRGFWLLGREGAQDAVIQNEYATAEARSLGGLALACALAHDAMARQQAGDLETAERLLKEGIAVGEPLNASMVMWSGDSGLADIAYSRGDYRVAIAGYLRSLELADLRHDLQQIAFDLSSLAACVAELGDDRNAALMLALLDRVCEERGATRHGLLPFSVGLATAEAGAARLAADMLAEIDREAASVPPAQHTVRARQLGATVLAEIQR